MAAVGSFTLVIAFGKVGPGPCRRWPLGEGNRQRRPVFAGTIKTFQFGIGNRCRPAKDGSRSISTGIGGVTVAHLERINKI